MSNEARSNWTLIEDVTLCECWVQATHDPITGNEMQLRELWKTVLALFSEKHGNRRTDQALQSRWKTINPSLICWRDALAAASHNLRSGENLSDQTLQAQAFYNAKNKNKSFNRWECWEVVKDCPKYKIVPVGPEVVMNEFPLHSPPEVPSNFQPCGSFEGATLSPEGVQETPENIPEPTRQSLRPQGRKAAKKKGSCSKPESSRMFEQLHRQTEVNLGRQVALEEAKHDLNVIRHAANERERELQRQERMAIEDRRIMKMSLEGMSPNSKFFWRSEKAEAVQRRRARNAEKSGGDASTACPSSTDPSTTDWLGDEE